MPSKKLQELADAIKAHRQQLLNIVAGLSDAQFDFKPADNRWSIADILHHLALVEEGNGKLCSMMLKKADGAGGPLDAAPDASVLAELEAMKTWLLNRENKVTAPERVAPLSYLTAKEGLAKLAASRERLLQVIEPLSRYDLHEMKWPHPIAGEMNLYGWIMMIGLHELRHGQQIEEIKSLPNFPRE